MRLLTVLVVIFVLAGCGGARSSSANNTLLEGTSSTTRAPLPPGQVFLIMLENKTYDKALGENYTASLASNYAVATNYHAVAHPSLPNYLVLTSGSTWDVVDDEYHVLPSDHDLGSELSSAGIPWRAYMEDMSKGCFDSKYPYALKHNPFAYYGGQCSSNVVDLSQLDADLAGNTPNFVWITPNMCHDGHDCSVSTTDQWLAEVVPKITASSAWKEDGVLFIVWDEDDDEKPESTNRVGLIVVAPNLKINQTDAYYDHYSLLSTIEDQLGVEHLGEDTDAQPLKEFFKP